MKPKMYFYYNNFRSQFDDGKGGKYGHPEMHVCMSYQDYRDRNKEVLPERWHSFISFKSQTNTGCRHRPYAMEITIKSTNIKQADRFMDSMIRYFKRDFGISFLDVLEFLMKKKKAKRLDRDSKTGNICLYKPRKAKC